MIYIVLVVLKCHGTEIHILHGRVNLKKRLRNKQAHRITPGFGGEGGGGAGVGEGQLYFVWYRRPLFSGYLYINRS